MYNSSYRKKRGKWWIFSVFILALAVGLGIGYAGAKLMTVPEKIEALPKTLNNSSESETVAPVPDAETESKAVTAVSTPFEDNLPKMPPKEGFLVKISDGKVCVFKIYADGTTAYSQTLPVELGDLPQADQEKLKSGIYLETRTELAELTEDYSS